MQLFRVALILLMTASASALVIDFDTIDASAGPEIIAGDYAAQGVVFSFLAVHDVSNESFYTTGAGASEYSPDNVGRLSLNHPSMFETTIFFQHPVSGVDLAASSVTMTLLDPSVGSILADITAYNIAGMQIYHQVFVTDPNQFEIVGIGGSINEIRIVSDIDGVDLDDLTIIGLPFIPEPAMAMMFILGSLLILKRNRA